MSLSLFIIGEYSSLFALQLAFVFTFFKSKKIFYLFYAPMIYFVMLKLFASSVYFLYFLNLLFLCYFLYINELLLNREELAIFSTYMVFLYGLYHYVEEDVYNLYITLGTDDKVNHIFDEVTAVLAFLHIFIFMILGYNKQKLFRK
jgi:hypothetical protein